METTSNNNIWKLWWVAVGISVLLVVMGGRTWKEVEVTWHFLNEHKECIAAKQDAMQPTAKWDFNQTVRNPCAFYYDPKFKMLIVIICAIVGRKLILITGFQIGSRQEYMNRKCNRY